MRIDVNAPDFIPGWSVWDLDTGREVTLCIWADDDTGEYERYVTDASGLVAINWAAPPEYFKPQRERGRGRIVLVPPGAAPPIVLPVP
jgi:hypothetical protein